MYDMILSLLSFRFMPDQILSANKKCKLPNLSNNDYDKLQLIVNTLKPAKVKPRKNYRQSNFKLAMSYKRG